MVEGRSADGAAAGSLGHHDDIPWGSILPRGDLVGHTHRPHASREPVPYDHVPAYAKGASCDDGNVYELRDSRNARYVVEELGHVSVVGQVDIGEKGHGLASHDVYIPQCRPGDVEPRQEGVVREPRMHAVHGHHHVLTFGLHNS